MLSRKKRVETQRNILGADYERKSGDSRGAKVDKGGRNIGDRGRDVDEARRWRRRREELSWPLAMRRAAELRSYMHSTRLTIRAPRQLKCSSSFYRIIIMNQR